KTAVAKPASNSVLKKEQPYAAEIVSSAQLKFTAEPSQEKVQPSVQFPAVVLEEGDRDTLSSLAAIQIRYNKPSEAVPYLMMLRKTDPYDARAARLLALALIKMGKWEQAETVLADMEGLVETPEPHVSGLLTFYRSIVAFKQSKFSAARHWFQRFRALVGGMAR
ncbi:MAG: tetratricopeptide repeat protein, partial [Pseudomonadota bacterium]